MYGATHVSAWSPGHSLSAPKQPTRSSHTSSHSSLSPGVSPRQTAALNFPLIQGSSYFFNREVALRELWGLGHIGEVQEDDEGPEAAKMGSRSAELKAMSVAAFYENIRENSDKLKSDVPTSSKPALQPNLQSSVSVRRDWTDYSAGSNFTPSQAQQFTWEILPEKSPERVQTTSTMVTQREEGKTEFLLQPPPKKAKRAQRGTFASENVLSSRMCGTLKFYNLKKRFGFISPDNFSFDVFLCEDDLVLSDINHKKFKEEVAAGLKPRFEFSVKEYREKDQQKKKAVALKLLDGTCY